jgi:hypothetical protein
MITYILRLAYNSPSLTIKNLRERLNRLYRTSSRLLSTSGPWATVQAQQGRAEMLCQMELSYMSKYLRGELLEVEEAKYIL